MRVEKMNGQDPSATAALLGGGPEMTARMKDPWNIVLSDDRTELNGSDPTDPGTTVKFTRSPS